MLVGFQLTRRINNALLNKVMSDSTMLHILQAQTQINHSGTGGNAIFKGKKEKETSDSFPESVWENIVRWIAFTEECTFIMPPASLSSSELAATPKRAKKSLKRSQQQQQQTPAKEGNGSVERESSDVGPASTGGYKESESESESDNRDSADSAHVSELFLLRAHTSGFSGNNNAEFSVPDEFEGGGGLAKDIGASHPLEASAGAKWKDFYFAQGLLELIDFLLFDPGAKMGSYSCERVRELDQALIRHSLRLTLYTLHETDAVFNTRKILHRREQLGESRVVVGCVLVYFYHNCRECEGDGGDLLRDRRW